MILPLILYDFLIYSLATFIYGVASLNTFYLGEFIFKSFGMNTLLVLIPTLLITFILNIIFETWFIRLLLPKLKEGTFDAPNSSMFYIWTFHFTLNRLLFLQPIKNIILYSVNLRYLAFKALGGNISYGCSISADVDLVDVAMLSIGKDCVIGSNTAMSGHFINKDKITFGKVKIGNKVNVGAFCHIAPNTVIGNNSWIGAESKISPLVKIGDNCSIEPMSFIYPGTKVKAGENYSNS